MDPVTISLTLVSHTNAGKTTLARTFLARDVGIVRDEAHVTETAEAYAMVETEVGDRLMLWDTPGFGDSARLARRLQQADNPLGWMIGQVWDRFRDRPLWSSQQALKSVRDHADVVLYLVSAAEDPADAGYVEPEMRVIEWTGKPVIVLLNQIGAPRSAAEEAAEVERWRNHLDSFGAVHAVLALDAFARCWVQEQRLLEEIEPLIVPARAAGFRRLREQWMRERQATFDVSMRTMSDTLAAAAAERIEVSDPGLSGRLREVGASLRRAGDDPTNARAAAMQTLAERWDAANRAMTDRLLALHGLAGHAAGEIVTRVESHFSIQRPLSEGTAAVLGGVATGALAGLKADIATGGFTLGGGMIAGSILGALGAAGLARGYNLVRGQDHIAIQWSDAVLLTAVASSLLTYLAVAHFGRGRGAWARAEYPAHWRPLVQELVESNRRELLGAMRPKVRQPDENGVAARLAPVLQRIGLEALRQLYPHARFDTRVSESSLEQSPEQPDPRPTGSTGPQRPAPVR